MMTEAEALETLAREDPAIAGDAKAALRWLTEGAGLESISLLRLQEFLWYVLPTSWPDPPSAHLGVARALSRLLTLAGLDRYGEVCGSAETAHVIETYGRSPADGEAAYRRERDKSPAVPPDTDLLAWSA